MKITRTQIIIAGTALLTIILICVGAFFLIKTEPSADSATTIPDETAKYKKLDNYCGWRGKDESGKWVYGDAYFYFDEEKAAEAYKERVILHALYYILADGKYTEVDSLTLTPCLAKEENKKIYYGDIVSFKQVFRQNYFQENDTVNIVAVAQICYTNEGNYPNGPECHAEGFIVKDGVKPYQEYWRKNVTPRVADYPEGVREKLPICESDNRSLCPEDRELLPGLPTRIQASSFEILGNIYDNQELLKSLSGLRESAKSYFEISRAEIGQIPRYEFENQ